MLHLIGRGQSLCLCSPNLSLQPGEGAAEEPRSVQSRGLDQPHLSPRHGEERRALVEHKGQHFSRRMEDAVLQQPRFLPEFPFFPKPTTATPASALYHSHNTWRRSRENPSQPVKRRGKTIHPRPRLQNVWRVRKGVAFQR